DLKFDPVSGMIWVTVPATDPNYPSSIVAIDPKTGAIGTQIAMGVEGNHLAITDDGQFAYMNCPADGSIRRANLQTGKKDSI
ncbi:hypothetical protein, partial [Klebsiella pneumoniae]|uniref:hypothetical protein n=1 Tax=Klebsiella pneumoniae TaxID=573 RepID=UPI003CECCF93